MCSCRGNVRLALVALGAGLLLSLLICGWFARLLIGLVLLVIGAVALRCD